MIYVVDHTKVGMLCAMGADDTTQSSGLPHLVTTYTARRDLVPVLKRELLDDEREVKLDEAHILLDIFRAKSQEKPMVKIDDEGFTTLFRIEAAQMISQPQVHRRVKQLLRPGREYLELKSSRTSTGGMLVRLTEKGEAFSARFWEAYRTLAASILAGTDPSELQSHLAVNFAILHYFRGLALPGLAPPKNPQPAENLLSVFAAAKAIRLGIERFVVRPGDGLSVERADLLVYLYVSPGFRSFGEIRRSLVHSFSLSRHLVSRWVGELSSEDSGFVETQQLTRKRMAAAITEKGADKVRPILERYRRLADNLMADISAPDREAHLLVNKRIGDSIRPRLEDLITEED
jgi:DNA-binding MarR family transcriptional regulator